MLLGVLEVCQWVDVIMLLGVLEVRQWVDVIMLLQYTECAESVQPPCNQSVPCQVHKDSIA
jgi:hypothetical protein